MKTWEIQLNHDHGHTTLIVQAADALSAKMLAMTIERCPARSILSIKEV